MNKLSLKVAIAILALVGLYAVASFAADATKVYQGHTIAGRGTWQESELTAANTLYKRALPVYFVSDDAATVNIDNGNEACSSMQLDCSTVWDVTVGTDADITVRTCSTDITDGNTFLAMCI